jgi:hypothetical protein
VYFSLTNIRQTAAKSSNTFCCEIAGLVLTELAAASNIRPPRRSDQTKAARKFKIRRHADSSHHSHKAMSVLSVPPFLSGNDVEWNVPSLEGEPHVTSN